MNSLIKRPVGFLLGKLGYEIRRKTSRPILWPPESLGYDHEQDAREDIKRVRDKTMVAYVSLVTLWQQVRYCEVNAIPGDYVECGVWKGGSVGLMALANLACGPERRDIHLFDVFGDICQPDPEVDGEKAVAEVEKFSGMERAEIRGEMKSIEGFYDSFGGAGELETVRRFLEQDIGYDPGRLHYHKGWFQDTLPVAVIERIACLRLDGDWYASTKVCLDHLYDKVVPGGIVIIDDYGCYEGCHKAVDEFLESRGIKAFLNHVNRDCRYWIKTG